MHAFNAKAGFVLPVVLGIVLLAGLFAVQAAIESGSTLLLATQRQLHQRTFEAAERGIAAALQQLESGAEPTPTQVLRSADVPADSSTVATTVTARQTLPEGFSAGRVVETSYEIRSTGHGARSSSVTVVQGVRQLRAVVTP
jgi:Tfp pilus assembly protein PilX